MMKLPEPTFNGYQIKSFKRQDIKFPEVSFLIVTRNRCPNKDPFNNPLIWAILSLEASRIKKVDEYLIIDDASNDYTEEHIYWVKESLGINVKYMKNDKRKGCSYSRRLGISKLENEVFFMGDDDCLYKPDFVFGSLMAFDYILVNLDNRLAVMGLPVYDREISFSAYVPRKEIGITDFDKTWFYHNFDKLPDDFKKTPSVLGNKVPINKPIRVETFKGVSLNLKTPIVKSGNFLDLSMWETDYSEHIELSYNLTKKGYRIYFLPDPKVSCTHLLWGANNKDRKYSKYDSHYFQGVGINLGKMLREANVTRSNTGSRVKNNVFHVCEIGSFFSFYLKIRKELAIKFAVKEYRNFVLKNLVYSAFSERINSRKTRKEIWQKAIRKGIRVTENQTKVKYKGLYSEVLEEVNKINIS